MARKFSRTALLSAFCISAMAISITGCDTNALTRRSAEKIINEHFHLPMTRYFYLREGEAKSDRGFGSIYIITEGTDGEFRDQDGFAFNEATSILSKLDSLGYIQARKDEALQKSYEAISITRKGKTQFQKAVWKGREQENWWKMPLMKYGVDQITGIALAGDNVTATVEFTMHDYDYDKPLVGLIAPRYLELNHRARNDAVPMRKYDDGWRIEEKMKRR
jgi:hypothetical protein